MKEKKGEHPFGDAGQMICFGLFMVLWLGDSFFVHQTTILAHYVPLFPRFIFLGLTLIAAFLLLRSSHFIVSSEARPDHVVDTGAFRRVRHPLYLAGILIYLGLSVSTASLVSLAAFGGIWIFYNYIAGYEEKLLQEKFGRDYRQYEQKTGRWFPRWGRSTIGKSERPEVGIAWVDEVFLIFTGSGSPEKTSNHAG